jgi:hypothetical protein
VLRSSGQPLETSTRAFFEPRFGHDFSKVRVHADEAAAASAKAVNALAYTSGDHVVWGGGRHALSSAAGRSLLAHELAHVVQQGGVNGTPTRVSEPSDGLERAADQAAETALDAPASAGPATGRESLAKGTLFRRVAGVTCAPDTFSAPHDPRAALEAADAIAIPLATHTATDLATDSNTVQGGIPAAPSASLQAFQNRFGAPGPSGKGFLNRLTGTTRPTREVALSEELAIVSRRFAGVASVMTQGLSYNCPGNHALTLSGCAPGTCAGGDAFSCPNNSLVAICPTFWSNFNDAGRAQILIHECLHINLAGIGVGSVLDVTTRGPGRNFNIAGCYEALLQDLTGANSQADCPAPP